MRYFAQSTQISLNPRQTLLKLTVQAILPRRCGGCEASAVYVDIDGRFNVLRITAVIDCFKMVTSEGFLVDIQIESYAYKFDAEITYSYA